MKMELELDEVLNGFTREGMKSFIKKLLAASGDEEKRLLDQISKSPKNDLADLDDEMHGKPKTPKVTEDDLPFKGEDELPDVPKKRKA
jgi:predicted AAA+ superfamily ATPase